MIGETLRTPQQIARDINHSEHRVVRVIHQHNIIEKQRAGCYRLFSDEQAAAIKSYCDEILEKNKFRPAVTDTPKTP